MPSMERLRLENVLQTVSVLESVVLRSFGPEGGQVLFTRDTGQALLSRSGIRILTALRLEHPLARMVVECVLKHSSVTGDGSKTFILLLASILRVMHSSAFKEPRVSHNYNSREAAAAAAARHLANKLLAFALEELDDVIAVGVVPYGYRLLGEDFTPKTQLPAHANNHCFQMLLASFFCTRLGRTHCHFISDLASELLTHWKSKNHQPSFSLQFVNDNFPALSTPVSGFPLSCSRVVEGQVIHRDFATPCPQTDRQPVRAVVFTGCLQPKLSSDGEVLELGGGEQAKERSIMRFNAWSERSLACVVAKLQSLGVSVILTAVKQSAAVLALAAQADMCVVECVSEDELSLFGQLSGATPVSDCWTIEPDHVATLTFCRPILLGAHRYVHVAFQDPEERLAVKPCSLIICGPGEGQTDQHACAFQDALRMLLSALEPTGLTAASKRTWQPNKSTSPPKDNAPVLEAGYVLPVGGTFEFLLHRALVQHGSSRSVSDGTNAGIPAACQLLANALLSVPQHIYSHRPRCFLQTQTSLLKFIPRNSHPFNLVYKQEHKTILMRGPGRSGRPLEEGKQGMHCCGEADTSTSVFMLNTGLESVSCKHQLLVAVLQCASSLLDVDAVLHAHTASPSRSRSLANVSLDEAED